MNMMNDLSVAAIRWLSPAAVHWEFNDEAVSRQLHARERAPVILWQATMI